MTTFTAGRVRRAILGARRHVRVEARKRAREAAPVMLAAAREVLSNPPPSAPGQPPARRTGDVQRAWYAKPRGMRPGIDVPVTHGFVKSIDRGHKGVLRGRTVFVQKRPFVVPIKARAWSEVRAIFIRPYMTSYRGEGAPKPGE